MRVRVLFAKEGEARYISHLDLCRTFERAFRRGRIPVSYSQGFNPKPRFSLASALMLGAESSGEVMDVHLDRQMALREFAEALGSALVPGIRVERARTLEPAAKDCAASVAAARYIITFCGPDEDARLIAQRFLQAASVMVRKQSKGRIRSVNARTVVLETEAISASQVAVLLDLSGPSLKPSEVAIAMLGLLDGGAADDRPATGDFRICRKELLARQAGILVPLFLAST